MRKLTLFLIFSLITVIGFAQNNSISADNPQQFLTDVKTMFTATQNEVAAKVGSSWETAWNSGRISSSQQKKIMELTQEMLKKRLRARPHFEDFFGALGSSVNVHQFTGDKLDQLLKVTEQTLQKHDYKVYERYLNSAHQFLSTKALFQGKSNGLKAVGGSFTFEYRDATADAAPGASWDNAPKPVKAPAAAPAQNKVEEEDPWGDWDKPKKKTPAKSTKGKTAAAPKKAEPEPAVQEPAPQEEPVFYEEPLPQLSGPVVVLQNANLLFTSSYDSITIKGVSGAMSLEGGKYAGKGGKITWSHMGVQATAELGNLVFDRDKPSFKAENVLLKHPTLLENDIRGDFEYRLSQPKANGDRDFPKFISRTSNAKIKKFGAGLKYVGGLSIAGQALMSAALDGSPSTIVVSEGGEPKFRASARAFTITDSLIKAPEASIALYQGKDSIAHPGVNFNFNRETSRLVLSYSDGVFRPTPYFDSYHQVELLADAAIWNLKESQINFTILSAKSQVPAQVNSREYYTEGLFNQIRSISNFHPLYLAVGYGQQQGTREYYLADMVRDTKMDKEVLHNTLTSLARGNFLGYNPATGHVQLREKAIHFVEASRGRRDYDFIHLNALSPSGRNATIDLETGDLVVRGVKKFTFTKDSTVTAEPDSQIVRIKKNRNILFNGRVKSADFTFKGKEFLFDYDGFFIDLAKIDSTILTTKTKDKSGNLKSTPYTLVSRSGKGVAKLYLNRPDNKSGQKKYGGYPALDAISGATVYFNKPEILGGVYDTTVFFSIPPFKVDSMSNGGESVIGLSGTFHSGGIFPPIETKLSVQPDGALGFQYFVPKGIEVYGGKGKFSDTLTLDTKGLRGNGTLSYQTATMQSPSFVFFKDSAITDSGVKGSFTAGSVQQGSYPSGTFKGYTMEWWPYRDTLQIETKGQELMSMFSNRFTYKGMLGFTPSALFGDGVIENKDVAIKSPLFTFKKGLIHGNRASMEISSSDKTKPALTTFDVFLDFFLDEGYAKYAPERKGFASTVFPLAQYKSSLGGGHWSFKEKKLTLSSGEAGDNESYFYSMKTGMDSLRFKASNAVYDLSNYTLVATGVPYIPVGDSYIIPDSNRVHILEDAKLKTFQNAALAMDSVQKYHQMVRGELHLDNAFGITGNAVYKFTNSASNSYDIKFNNFAWNAPELSKKEERKGEMATPHFLATAQVAEEDTVFILPNVRYYGTVSLASNKQYMNFDGFAKLQFSSNESSDWFPFKRDELNPEDVRLEIRKAALADGTPLKTGIHINASDGRIYNTFVSKKQYDDDLDVFEVEGLLSFDKETKQYKLGDENRAFGSSYTGNVLHYNNATKEVKYEGAFNLIQPAKGFKLQVSGNGSGRTDSSLYALDTFMAFDFDVPSQAIENMAKNLVKNVQGAPEGVDLNSASLPYKLAAFIGDKGVEDFKAKTANGYVPFSKISSKLVRSLVLNNVQLKWSPVTNAWYSVGPLSIAGIDKTDVNAKINGYIEIKRGASGDVVSVYLEPNPYGWYYLNFYEGGLGLVASDGEFNSVISKKSNGKSPGSYSFYPLEQIDKMEFVNYFRKNYLGKGPAEAPPQPTYDTFASADEEEASGKKAKKDKKKKGKDDENGPAPAGFDIPVADAPADSKKSKKKNKEENTDAKQAETGDIPVAEEAETPAKESKKERKKKQKEAEAESTPDIPVAEPAKDSKKDKKKKKKGEEEAEVPPPDIPIGN
ncbi:hypothetical protein [Rufibacter roseus]|uniref:Uncharacterized protein n=1 Tax=Rufibacter roseus TaxID=1567108 RepID=A0ABW2DEL8_9BACT|nr:hypothetical protein [Rufibacter roseus]